MWLFLHGEKDSWGRPHHSILVIKWDLPKALRLSQYKDPHGGADRVGNTQSEEELGVIWVLATETSAWVSAGAGETLVSGHRKMCTGASKMEKDHVSALN